jgi:hypothetical protein
MAESKSDQFSFLRNGCSENHGKFSPSPVNSLASVSECAGAIAHHGESLRADPRRRSFGVVPLRPEGGNNLAGMQLKLPANRKAPFVIGALSIILAAVLGVEFGRQ